MNRWLKKSLNRTVVHPETAFKRPDPHLLHRLAGIETLCLAAVAGLTIPYLLKRLISGMGYAFPISWTQMSLNSAIAALAAATAFVLALSSGSRSTRILRHLLAAVVAVTAIAELANNARIASLGTPGAELRVDFLLGFAAHMPGLAAAAWVLMAVVLMILPARKGALSMIADGALVLLATTVLVLASAYVIASAESPGAQDPNHTSRAMLCVLLLLTFVATTRRAQNGYLQVLLGDGIGSRIGRALTPLLLVLPFLREIARARLMRHHLLPEHYSAAILASIAAILSICVLIGIARYIETMEGRIRELSLRDELTGLYNVRGFRLLAEQALRLAQRSGLPFSVLFVDLDNLKQINDTLGHAVGSEYLARAGDLLRASFRETDVMGRVGGDEFAVAGQFSRTAIALAAQRLQNLAAEQNIQSAYSIPFTLSVGHVTAKGYSYDSLELLLDRADAAMYEEKKLKKMQLA